MEVKFSAKKIVINHLYSKNLNLYGDTGNVKAICHKLEELSIDYELINTEIYDNKIGQADIYFMGGGQDSDQFLIFKHLLKFRDFLLEEYLNSKIFLLICGGYQLFGKFFLDASGRLIEGLGIIDIETKASENPNHARCIGNLVCKLSPDFIQHWSIDTKFSDYIIGFENHSGQTYILKDTVRHIGDVVTGYGNNFMEKREGSWSKNLIGTYCHGSFLPKNPHVTSSIIEKVLQQKYGTAIEKRLYSKTEVTAHKYMLTKLIGKR